MKKFLSRLLTISLMASTALVAPVFAEDGNTLKPIILTESGKTIMPDKITYYESGEAPNSENNMTDKARSFVRTYTEKINSNNYTIIMSENNFYLNDDTIRITLVDDGKNGTEDVEIIIYEYSPYGDKGYTYTLSKGDSTGACQIKGGNNFSVHAKYKNTTTDGNIEIEVSLQQY